MLVLTGTQFRANQSKYVGAAQSGEDIIVKSKAGSYRIVPLKENDEKYLQEKDELAHSLYRSMKQAKLAKAGKVKLHSWEDMINELED